VPDNNPNRDTYPVEGRPGRSGPDTGNETSGEGAEFLGDPGDGDGRDPDPEPDAAGSWLAAHGESADDK
jgi:hypothetical protein